jgi:16S rRNA (cytosine1402-N4)-methyltransferase
VPVLVQGAVRYLNLKPEGIYVDGTVGSGGHSLEILRHLPEKGRLICLDQDPDAIRLSQERLGSDQRANFIQANFADLDGVMQNLAIDRIDGILLDLGMSSYQIEKSGRGFSFNKEEPLDMRMNPDHKPTGEHLINSLSVESIQRLLQDYGEERRARTLARAIVTAREQKTVKTASQLAKIIEEATPKAHGPWKRHPATKTFQALRIAINQEMDKLETFLHKIPSLLAGRGRLVVISYHSLEDRQVKKQWSIGKRRAPVLLIFQFARVAKFPLSNACLKRAKNQNRRKLLITPEHAAPSCGLQKGFHHDQAG